VHARERERERETLSCVDHRETKIKGYMGVVLSGFICHITNFPELSSKAVLVSLKLSPVGDFDVSNPCPIFWEVSYVWRNIVITFLSR
jgi:hypothetical protein